MAGGRAAGDPGPVLACRPLGTVAEIATLATGGQGKSAASQMYSHERSSGTDLARVM